MPAYKDESRGTWYAKFQYKEWTGETKQRLKRGFKTKKEALAYERDFLNQIGDKNLTVGHLCSMFLEDKKHRIKLKTYSNYVMAINLVILPYFHNRICSEIQPNDIIKWQNELFEKKMAAATIRYYHSVFTSVFIYGNKFHGIPNNPLKIAGLPPKQKSKKEIKFWTPEQFEQFMTAVTNPIYKFMFPTLYYSGMRVGECLALKWNDVDWEEGTIRVDETMTTIGGEIYVTSPKTEKSNRTIYMPDFWMEMLREFRTHCTETEEDDRIFTNVRTAHSVRGTMVFYINRSGVPHITTHDLRHSHASLLIDMGMPITMISERLGHDNPSITLSTYSHMFPTRQKDFAEKLENLYQTRITKNDTEK